MVWCPFGKKINIQTSDGLLQIRPRNKAESGEMWIEGQQSSFNEMDLKTQSAK